MKYRILIVERDEKYRTELCAWLKDIDAEITTALSYRDALTCLGKNVFDVVVIDFCMEQDTADMVCWTINRGDRDRTALIVTSPEQSMEMEKRIRSFSPVVYLVKPYDVNDVYATISRVLDRRRMTAMASVAAMDDETRRI